MEYGSIGDLAPLASDKWCQMRDRRMGLLLCAVRNQELGATFNAFSLEAPLIQGRVLHAVCFSVCVPSACARIGKAFAFPAKSAIPLCGSLF